MEDPVPSAGESRQHITFDIRCKPKRSAWRASLRLYDFSLLQKKRPRCLGRFFIYGFRLVGALSQIGGNWNGDVETRAHALIQTALGTEADLVDGDQSVEFKCSELIKKLY